MHAPGPIWKKPSCLRVMPTGHPHAVAVSVPAIFQRIMEGIVRDILTSVSILTIFSDWLQVITPLPAPDRLASSDAAAIQQSQPVVPGWSNRVRRPPD